MLLLADSGSTKTDWRLINEKGIAVECIKTQGLNPYFLTEDEIFSVVLDKVSSKLVKVDKVFFYGAGCGLPVKADQVKNAIIKSFSTIPEVEVFGDILGAARGLFQDQPGLACIIGTGANSCIYDGHTIIDNVPSLGFILADWGSGTVISKDFISLLLQEKLSIDIRNDFYSVFKLDRREILDNIYNKPMANRFLASFTPFLLKYADDDPICRNIITNNFRNFFDYYVLKYEHRENFKISITGSVAYHFRKFLYEVADEMDVNIEKVVQHPMEGLVQYHMNKMAFVRS